MGTNDAPITIARAMTTLPGVMALARLDDVGVNATYHDDQDPGWL